jgi:hypothetical protein
MSDAATAAQPSAASTSHPRLLAWVAQVARAGTCPTPTSPALHVDTAEWVAELPQITAWFPRFGDKLPATLWAELDTLHHRLTTR